MQFNNSNKTLAVSGPEAPINERMIAGQTDVHSTTSGCRHSHLPRDVAEQGRVESAATSLSPAPQLFLESLQRSYVGLSAGSLAVGRTGGQESHRQNKKKVGRFPLTHRERENTATFFGGVFPIPFRKSGGDIKIFNCYLKNKRPFYISCACSTMGLERRAVSC